VCTVHQWLRPNRRPPGAHTSIASAAYPALLSLSAQSAVLLSTDMLIAVGLAGSYSHITINILIIIIIITGAPNFVNRPIVTSLAAQGHTTASNRYPFSA